MERRTLRLGQPPALRAAAFGGGRRAPLRAVTFSTAGRVAGCVAPYGARVEPRRPGLRPQARRDWCGDLIAHSMSELAHDIVRHWCTSIVLPLVLTSLASREQVLAALSNRRVSVATVWMANAVRRGPALGRPCRRRARRRCRVARRSAHRASAARAGGRSQAPAVHALTRPHGGRPRSLSDALDTSAYDAAGGFGTYEYLNTLE